MAQNEDNNINNGDNGNQSDNGYNPELDPADIQVSYEILEDENVSIEDKIACLLTMQPDLTLSKKELKNLISDKGSSEIFLAFIKGLKDVHTDFEHMMEHIRDILNSFQKMHPQQLTCMSLFHIEGNPYTKQKGMGGVSHCMTNILNTDNDEMSVQEQNHIIEILFNNSKINRAFCDIIVGTYLCIKKAGMDKGSSYINDNNSNPEKK